ncbi:Carbohydrate binding domain protein [Histomonas meleagridis]|uniref:Carbohydrate binding domain protein n=1 Tax=Histomonas meleagridis TaxID=135588 RepID=UPI00355AAB90|nr:Carbohydrate binding domain protein [Histomonas meleagridis]
MDPENIIKGYVSNSTAYFYDAFPDDVIVDENNQIITSWSVNNLSCPACSTLEECPRVGCAVLCDLRAPEYAKKKLDKEISSGYNFTTRFIDTTFASPYRECYHPDHPMTRTMSLEARIELLKEYTNRGFVVGTENGKEQAIPNCDFFEGMMSPGEYRVPNSGRDLETVFTYVPEETQYMVDETLRIPLFELVYHDCVISYWYWGDHNSKVIPQWDKRDLFNRLYGTPPMFLFNQTIWERYKNRFVQSYKTAEEISYLTGYYEMSDHKYLSDDWKVQQTVFGNNRVIVTVNFGDKKFGGIEPMSSTVIVYTDAPPWAIAVIVIAAVVIDGITFLVLFIMNRKKGEEKDSNED